ncbi:hypothetical protein Ppro_1619 [Pelobacter propionicus DSM 2379]|uniref:Uncharacterized protein n=1 Tax=Pelobacter propionicus (strain DSM 2379 / NBRC 103807 / OttBd1) TaxID=338966 RepID=A1APG4_PELPD|nr:hypothetical protein Ppro_1619 [Pelobacter propionicus DSM 2379]
MSIVIMLKRAPIFAINRGSSLSGVRRITWTDIRRTQLVTWWWHSTAKDYLTFSTDKCYKRLARAKRERRPLNGMDSGMPHLSPITWPHAEGGSSIVFTPPELRPINNSSKA